jgi:hypothetical protein
MQDDQTIARIWEERHRISKQVDHDSRKLVEHSGDFHGSILSRGTRLP